MRWKKLGLIWKPDGSQSWARSHGMLPTPFRLNEQTLRVYVTCCDEQGRGRPAYVDLAADDPRRVLAVAEQPLLDLGRPGSFDDNGVVAISLVRVDAKKFFLYYAGFELGRQVRYRIFTGLAVSEDGGASFRRHSNVPILDRSEGELYFRAGPFAMLDDGRFKLWYVAGDSWTEIDGKAMPVYDLRYLESADGVRWGARGELSLAITGADEHGFGRPWVIKRGPQDYQLFYSIRRRSLGAYRLGYAESRDGIHWTRKDDQMGLDVTPGEFDSDAIMYSAVISVGAKTYCFYNGNNFGERGFAAAVLETSA